MGRDTAADDPYDPGDEVRRYPAVPLLVPAAARRWRQVFSGEERQLGLMRRWLAACLPDCPTRDDVISVATELGSNAILHTASGRGGWFAVELTWDPSMVRIAVADHGSPAEPHMIEDPDGEHGRGLLLVHGLSARTGVTGSEQGRIVWAEIAGTARHRRLAAAGPGEAEIRDGEAALARRFTGVPVWFGRATQGVVGARRAQRPGDRPDGAGTGRLAAPAAEHPAPVGQCGSPSVRASDVGPGWAVRQCSDRFQVPALVPVAVTGIASARTGRMARRLLLGGVRVGRWLRAAFLPPSPGCELPHRTEPRSRRGCFPKSPGPSPTAG